VHACSKDRGTEFAREKNLEERVRGTERGREGGRKRKIEGAVGGGEKRE
jgi:hypothetical protein